MASKKNTTKAAATQAKLSVASVLAFTSKIDNSAALLFSGNWDQRNERDSFDPLHIHEKSVIGTISHRLASPENPDPSKIDAEINKANLQTVDAAMLRFQHDTLRVDYTLRILSGVSEPFSCNSPAYRAALKSTVDEYIERTQLFELASRYATNIANGRFLWRNLEKALNIEVQVSYGDKKWVFDAYDFDLRKFDTPTGDLLELTKAIQESLLGNTRKIFTISAFTQMGHGQTVYPSQELILSKGGAATKGEKSKFLYQIEGIAGFHTQKIGNALQTIDTWYEEGGKPIAVGPFGSVTTEGAAYRKPMESKDFYTIFDDWVLKGVIPSIEQQHYTVAVLIHGGVFSGKSSKKDKETEEEQG